VFRSKWCAVLEARRIHLTPPKFELSALAVEGRSLASLASLSSLPRRGDRRARHAPVGLAAQHMDGPFTASPGPSAIELLCHQQSPWTTRRALVAPAPSICPGKPGPRLTQKPTGNLARSHPCSSWASALCPKNIIASTCLSSRHLRVFVFPRMIGYCYVCLRDGVVSSTLAQMHLLPFFCHCGRCKPKSRIDREGKLQYPMRASMTAFTKISDQTPTSSHIPQPTCSKSGGLPRIVGQYEGWSIDRNCQPFVPEQIPKGVYTHLNYAYATIEPTTFEIRPGYLRDPDMYRRFTRLKRRDPNLKVSIAIGSVSITFDQQRTWTDRVYVVMLLILIK
jgi:hypothetical protein